MLKRWLRQGRMRRLCDAAKRRSTWRVRWLLWIDPSLLDASYGEWTPLETATAAGSRRVVEYLLARGADVNGGAGGCGPLHQAAMEGEDEIAALLLANGADPDAKGGAAQMTPLHWAALVSATGVASMLIGAGADVNARSSKGLTPLGIAARHSQDAMVEFLRAHGGE